MNGARAGHHVEVNIVVDRLPIDFGDAPGKSADRLEAGGEHERARDEAVAERACARAVDREHRLAAACVEDGKSPCSRESGDNVLSLSRVAVCEGMRRTVVLRKRSKLCVGKARVAPNCNEPIIVLEDIGTAAGRRQRAETVRGAVRGAVVEASEVHRHRGHRPRIRGSGAPSPEPTTQSAHRRGTAVTRNRVDSLPKLFKRAPPPEPGG